LQMKTIAIDCRKINDGGIGTYLSNMLKCWSNTKTDLRFVLFCHPKDRGSLEFIKDRATILDHDYSKYSVRELFSFRKPLIEYKADLFFSPHYTLPFNLPCKSIVVIHDLIHLKLPVKGGIIGRTYARKMIKHAGKNADNVITVSEYSKNDLAEYFPDYSSKYKVIENGVDHDIFKPLPEDIISQFKKEKSLPEKFILYVGALKPHKNPKALLTISSALEADLVVCSNDKEAYKRLAQSAVSIKNRLSLVNTNSHEELAMLYNAADMFFFPSLYEGFGLPPLEAMACGTPVACSNIASLPEVVGDSAVTFTPNNQSEMINAAKSVWDDNERQMTLIAGGLKQAGKFSWGKSADRLYDLFMEVIGG